MSKTLSNLRHARSKKDFPFLSLAEDEYVVLKITRSRAGLIIIWFAEIVLALLLTLVLILLSNSDSSVAAPASLSILRIIILVVYFVLLLSGLIGTKVYLSNKLFITNKRAIEFSSNALFHTSTSVIELSRIEDVSFKKSGILDYAFRMGTIRLSTVGDEHTYTFPFIDTPTDEMQTISSLIHDLKTQSDE